MYDELIKQARELCGETYTGNGDGARIWLVNKIAEYPHMILDLADALEAAQKENEQLTAKIQFYESVSDNCSYAGMQARAEWYRCNMEQKKRLAARAEKAESYICQLKKQLSGAMKERDTYKAEAEKAEAGNCWIPISEKLPENCRSVLIYTYEGIFSAFWGGEKWHCALDNTIIRLDVTHWREHPSPPQEGE